jgi:hypothetical protein
MRRAVLVAVCWLTVLAVSPYRHVSPRVHDIALLVHLGSMVIGFGAVLLRELARHPVPPTSLLVRSGIATMISQAGWWTALVLGYLNSRGG